MDHEVKLLGAPKEEVWISTQKRVEPTSVGTPSRSVLGGFVTTFEITLEPNERFHTIWLKTKWRYRVATLYGDGKFIGDWYPEFNDMLAQLMLPIRHLESYMQMTGRTYGPNIEEGQIDLMLPLTLADKGPQTLEYLSQLYRTFKLEYDFTTKEGQGEALYVQIVKTV